MAGTARCASRGCRQVFGLVDMEGLAFLLARRFPGQHPSAFDEFVSTYRCGAVPGWARKSRTGFPFHPAARAVGTDNHNIVWFQ